MLNGYKGNKNQKIKFIIGENNQNIDWKLELKIEIGTKNSKFIFRPKKQKKIEMKNTQCHAPINKSFDEGKRETREKKIKGKR